MSTHAVRHCHTCGRGLTNGDMAYVEDWTSLWPTPHTERRYFCEPCHEKAATA